MFLKIAEPEDTDFILGASEDLHSKFSTVSFDKETTKDTIHSFLEADPNEAVIIIAYDKDKYLGVVAAMASLVPFSKKVIAKELLFWTNGKPKVTEKLYEAYDTWARSINADQILMSAPAAIRSFDKWNRYYTKKGYEPQEHVFVKDLGD